MILGNPYLFKSARLKILENEWHTPNTYNTNFMSVPDRSGVYFLVFSNPFTLDHEVLYVGSAKSLKKRYDRHEVLRILKIMYHYVTFYFKEYEDYRSEEFKLIRAIRPKFNTKDNG